MSEKIYRLLLSLYPTRFRKEYGDEALQLFRDRLRDEPGRIGRLRLWFDMVVDLCWSLPSEYRRTPAMAPVRPLSGMPAFEMLETEPPRPASFLLGAALALASVATFSFLLSHGGANRIFHASVQRLRGGTLPAEGRGSSAAQLGAAGRTVAGTPDDTQPKVAATPRPSAEPFLLDDAERHRVITAVIATLHERPADDWVTRKIAGLLLVHERSGDYGSILSGRVFAAALTDQVAAVLGAPPLRVIYRDDPGSAGVEAGAVRQIDEHFALMIP